MISLLIKIVKKKLLTNCVKYGLLIGKMIKPSKLLREIIEGFESKDDFCQKIGVSVFTLERVLDGTQSCSGRFIESVKEQFGLDFEAAFEITEDSK